MKLKPADIRMEWDRIREPIAEIMAGDGERAEDVYADCRHGKAHLYTCPEGFVVLRRYPREDTGRPEVLIWVAYGEGGKSLTQMYMPQLVELCRQVGAETMALRTRRRGFERVLDPRWRLRAIEYEMRIDYGQQA